MRVAIDISPLSSGHKGRGVGVYTKELIEALQTYEPQHTYKLVTGEADGTHDADIIHYPFFDLFFLTLPIIKKKPTVVTVHDLIPLVFPNKFPTGIRGSLKWLIQKLSLFGATRIITDSHTSKHDIVTVTGFDEKKIDVVYLAPADSYKPILDKKVIASIKKKFSLPEQYILYVGDVNWNKNIPGLIRGFSEVVTRSKKSDMKLVLVGKAFLDETLQETKTINGIVRELGMEDYVLRVGFVEDTELAVLYSQALCLVQPSFYEGFGLPVLEAYACGCPVVAADNSSLSEIAGPAVKVSAEKSEYIAQGIERMITMTQDEKERMRKEQAEWVKQFTWKKTAHETVASYERSLK